MGTIQGEGGEAVASTSRESRRDTTALPTDLRQHRSRDQRPDRRVADELDGSRRPRPAPDATAPARRCGCEGVRPSLAARPRRLPDDPTTRYSPGAVRWARASRVTGARITLESRREDDNPRDG